MNRHDELSQLDHLCAAELGRDRRQPLRVDWEQIKDDMMRPVVREKFRAHADLRATGDVKLFENAPGDYYWDCGAGGSGRNILRRIPMELRAELRSKGASHADQP